MNKSIENINLSQTHCIFFIYYTFACYNNGSAQEVEIEKIISYMKKWESKNNLCKKIMKETVTWSSNVIKSSDEAISTMFSMADYLNTENNFNSDKKEQLLLDIRAISRIDGVFSEKEKKWHDLIAHNLKINLRVSSCSKNDIEDGAKRLKRKKIGFIKN